MYLLFLATHPKIQYLTNKAILGKVRKCETLGLCLNGVAECLDCQVGQNHSVFFHDQQWRTKTFSKSKLKYPIFGLIRPPTMSNQDKELTYFLSSPSSNRLEQNLIAST